MKIFQILFILSLSGNLLSQGFEAKVLDCINDNFKQVGMDYFQILKEVEEELISCEIIQNSNESRLHQIWMVSKIGVVEKSRTYENIQFENLGFSTVKYCTDLHTYGDNGENISSLFRLLQEIEYIKYNSPRPISLDALRKEIASSILTYKNFDSGSKLWKIIQLEYLYFFSELDDYGRLPTLPPFEDVPENGTTIELQELDKIILDNLPVEIGSLCQYLNTPIGNGDHIYLIAKENVKYEWYIDVYNVIAKCIQNWKEQKSMDEYGLDFTSLISQQKADLEALISTEIIEIMRE